MAFSPIGFASPVIKKDKAIVSNNTPPQTMNPRLSIIDKSFRDLLSWLKYKTSLNISGRFRNWLPGVFALTGAATSTYSGSTHPVRKNKLFAERCSRKTPYAEVLCDGVKMRNVMKLPVTNILQVF